MTTSESRKLMCRLAFGAVFAACIATVLSTSNASAADYQIIRIASGLNQPSYVTQAPGDPANILYFTERASYDGVGTFEGFSAVNNMGKVWRYDALSRTKTLVVDLSAVFPARTVTNDTGIQTIAFSQDFNIVGAPTYHKMYISYSERGTAAINHVEEFDIGGNGTATFSRNILQYSNNTQNNHTVDWIGFDPTATGAARSYLYISTGDGAFGNPYSNGSLSGGRPSQNLASSRGKMHRVDVSGGNDYDGTHSINGVPIPADSERNFKIPLDNPLPTYNAAHLNNQISGRNEIYLTGLRNVYRASFDRATADLFMGDVGENAVEEVSFLKAGSTTPSLLPADFGWPIHEGTDPAAGELAPGSLGVPDPTVSGGPPHSTTTNPFTGVTSLKPIQQFPHFNGTGGSAVIGGYVYRGPIPSLQGKYFYADFVETNDVYTNFNPRVPQLYQLDFNRATDPTLFNGSNGTKTDISTLWNSLVIDPTDLTYSASAPGASGLDHIVSFGEDNAGNLYLVDFGSKGATQSTFDGEYPALGLGEIFKLIPFTPGDLSRDGFVTLDDLSTLMGALSNLDLYESTHAVSAEQFRQLGNLSGDAYADNADIQALIVYLANNGGGLGSLAAVPEPASWLLTIGGVLLLIFARNSPRGHMRYLAQCR
jgi:hypothetical protein